MADNFVRTRFLADSKQAQAEMARMEKRMRKLEDQAKRANQSSRRSSQQSVAGIRSMSSALARFTSGAAIAAAGVETIRDSLESTRRVAREAAEEQNRFAGSLRRTLINFAPDRAVRSPQALEAILRQIAEETGTDVNLVASGFSGAASARGALTNRQALEAVRLSAALAPGDAEILREFPQRLLDIQKITGADTGAAAGFLRQIQGAARITQLQQVGQTAPGTIRILTQTGDTAEQAAEMFAAMTSLLDDARGERTATGLASLATQLQKFAPLQGIQGTTARVRALQQDPALAQQFLAQASFEARSRGGFQALIRGTESAIREQAEAARKIESPLAAGQAQQFRGFIQELNRAPFAVGRTAEQQREQARQRLELGRDPRLNAARDALNEVLENANIAFGPDLPARLNRLAQFETRLTAGEDPIQAAIGQIRATIRGQGLAEIALTGDERDFAERQIQILRDLDAKLGVQIEVLRQNRRQPNRNANGENN